MIISDNVGLRDIKIPDRLPFLPVRDIVIFPHMVLPLVVGREKSINALETAMTNKRLIFISAQKKLQIDDPKLGDIYQVGIVAEVLQLLKMQDRTLKILVEGLSRGKITEFNYIAPKKYNEVMIDVLIENTNVSPHIKALMRQVVSTFEIYSRLNRRVPSEVYSSISSIETPARLADVIASHILIRLPEKQEILEIIDPQERLDRILSVLHSEMEVLNIERKIQSRVRGQIEKTQKEYYLNEQMKAIQKELKQKDENAKEIDDLRKRVREAGMSQEAVEVAEKELSRLDKMMPYSPEAAVIRSYIDWLLALPWAVKTEDHLDVKQAEKILNEDHYGLEKAKERVLEYLAVLKLVKKIKGPILCFVGPPGVGKTSLGRSIARALGRHFVRMSLGGVRDEAEIRGHRRTYIGSLPGRIIQSMRKAKTKNPVFLMDEIDKMGSDWRGDPTSALLEVLDPEQNNLFMDHYLDVEFDLSEVMFITTANTLYSIPPALQDRLEIIRFPGYTIEEKREIARLFLVPKQSSDHGISTDELMLDKDGLDKIIMEYTKEAGVRNLEREIANLCRKIAKVKAIKDEKFKEKLTLKKIEELLGIPKFIRNGKTSNEVGVVTGMAWTEVGGELLTIETNLCKGKGKLTLTGKLGTVMQESAQAALTYVRSQAKTLHLKERKFSETDFHIHVPEGAIPKDGPSAGIAMATALASAVTGKQVKKDLAMTGEITLRGRILPIGGFKEKVLAAYREDMKTIIFPEGNKKDLADIPDYVRKKIKFIPLKNMDEVLKISLMR
ncbi:MAG: endopeptidase La [bacterium]